MSNALSFAEIDDQHVELLPARTVLSLFSTGYYKGQQEPGAPGSGQPPAQEPPLDMPEGSIEAPVDIAI